MTKDEMIISARKSLDAAIKALENQAGSGVLSISVNGETQTFENRASCDAFIRLMERRIARLRGRRRFSVRNQQTTC